MNTSDNIDDSVSYVIGDGIITYYKNGLYYKHKFISNIWNLYFTTLSRHVKLILLANFS